MNEYVYLHTATIDEPSEALAAEQMSLEFLSRTCRWKVTKFQSSPSVPFLPLPPFLYSSPFIPFHPFLPCPCLNALTQLMGPAKCQQ